MTRGGGDNHPVWIILLILLVGAGLALLWAVFTYGKIANAQRTGYDAAYVRQAKADIARIEATYNATRDYYGGEVETPADAQAAHADMDALYESMETAPVAAAGVREQILFASWRCQNYAANVGWWKAEERSNVFSRMVEMQLREACAVQIHAARLRLIDYGVANGVDVYAR